MELLLTATTIERCSLLAEDGPIGGVEEFYFDDLSWEVRYLVVKTGGWLSGRRVLISPLAVVEVDEEKSSITIRLTRQQIENSPPIATDEPLSRQYEKEYFLYYDWPPYWEHGPVAPLPLPKSPEVPPSVQEEHETHLRSTAEVKGYTIAAQDGDIGHVDDFIVDTHDWAIRYLEIDTRNWWPGKHVLVNPGWIEKISWAGRAVSVGLERKAIKGAPEYDSTQVISRKYEAQLFKYYGRHGYWH